MVIADQPEAPGAQIAPRRIVGLGGDQRFEFDQRRFALAPQKQRAGQIESRQTVVGRQRQDVAQQHFGIVQRIGRDVAAGKQPHRLGIIGSPATVRLKAGFSPRMIAQRNRLGRGANHRIGMIKPRQRRARLHLAQRLSPGKGQVGDHPPRLGQIAIQRHRLIKLGLRAVDIPNRGKAGAPFKAGARRARPAPRQSFDNRQRPAGMALPAQCRGQDQLWPRIARRPRDQRARLLLGPGRIGGKRGGGGRKGVGDRHLAYQTCNRAEVQAPRPGQHCNFDQKLKVSLA